MPSWRLATSVTLSTWAVTWTLTWRAPLSTQMPCWAMRAGWPATSWHLTLPNRIWLRTTSPLDTRPETSSFTPACESLHHSKGRQEVGKKFFFRGKSAAYYPPLLIRVLCMFPSRISVTTAQSLAAPSIRRWTATWRRRSNWPGQLAAITHVLESVPNTSWIRTPPCL